MVTPSDIIYFLYLSHHFCGAAGVRPRIHYTKRVMAYFKETFKGFRYFWKGLVAAKREMWVSLQVLVVATLVLSVLLYLVEHSAQPDNFQNLWDSILWSTMNYLDNPGNFAPADPVTLVGRVLWVIISILKIAIFAVPAGLVAQGFMEAFSEEKRAGELKEVRKRLERAFRPVQCRYTKLKVQPRYVSVVDVQARQQIDVKDIMDAVNEGADFRFCNLASSQNVSEHPQDKLVIEHFPIAEGERTAYGCRIDRGSNVTIVGPSNVHEVGMSSFSRLVAELGGFNYVGKEWEVDVDNPVSFYVMEDPDDENSGCKAFVRDVRALSRGRDKWVVFMISASGAQEPAYPTDFHFIYGAEKGDEGYDAPGLTICDVQRFDAFYRGLSSRLQSDYGYESDRHRYHTGAGKKNIARRIGEGQETNAFTLRPSFKVIVWDDRNVAIARTIAGEIKEKLGS